MRRFAFVTAVLLIAAMGAFATPAAAATPTCKGKAATVVGVTGTSGDDVIVGTNGPDTITGDAGNDLICALDGDDEIDAGSGNDTVYGGGGDDNIHTFDAGTPDDDTYFGEGGGDVIVDNVGANVAKGGTGEDGINVTGQAYGEDGNDNAVEATETAPGAHDAYASGGPGNDFCYGLCIVFGDVVARGGTADGGSGNDRVRVLQDGDTASGGSGSDYVDGSAPGSQLLDCGSAYDTYLVGGTDTVRRCEQNVYN